MVIRSIARRAADSEERKIESAGNYETCENREKVGHRWKKKAGNHVTSEKREKTSESTGKLVCSRQKS